MESKKITKFVAKSAPSFNYTIERLSKQISRDARVGVELVHQMTEDAINEWQYQRNVPAVNLFTMSKKDQQQEIQHILALLENRLFKVISSKSLREHAIDVAEQNLEYALQLRPI